jgi:hypothetical protein
MGMSNLLMLIILLLVAPEAGGTAYRENYECCGDWISEAGPSKSEVPL